MAIIPQKELFSWEKIDQASDLDRLGLVLSVLPDEDLMVHLEHGRGRGRNEYPIRPCWNALVAGIVYQHESVASLLRELRRNGELRALCGFDPFLGARAVPPEYAFSRFLALVIEAEGRVVRIFDDLVAELARELADLGRVLAVDSKAITSFGKPVCGKHKEAKKKDHRRDADADWGTKSYRGVRQDGTHWEKAKSWFGYKLHPS